MDEKPFETMNVIPFVDIMLVLLTIVLTTSSFIATGKIPVNLPQASASEPETGTVRMIELSRDGGLYLDGAAVTLDALRAELAPVDKDAPFLIRADREIALQRFVDVADLLKQAGFAKVAVQTETRN
jgi:Biopolymer transport protein